MARIRSVKPSLRTSRVVAQWPHPVRYFWVLLWGYLDDEGRGLDNPRNIVADCYPLEGTITPRKIDRWLTLMATTRRDPDRDPPVCRYSVAGVRYLHAVHWTDDSNQRVNRPTPSRIPPCPIHEHPSKRFSELRITELRTERLTEPPPNDSRLEGEKEREKEREKEGEGERASPEPLTEPPAPAAPGPSPPPPRTCSAHPHGTEAPCHACKRAREAYEAWEADQRVTTPAVPAGPTCRTCGNATDSAYHRRVCTKTDQILNRRAS